MATHTSILAWKIPWTEKSGRLQSMESRRVEESYTTEGLSKKARKSGSGAEQAL